MGCTRIGALLGALGLATTLTFGDALAATCPTPDPAKVNQGLRISPVPVNTAKFGRNGVGLGSYIVNAQGGCNDCHTNPPYAPNGDPFQGQPEKINAAKFLGGGVSFGPTITSPNLTPDRNGLPAGMTFVQFRDTVMRHGIDPHEPGHRLQIMPWPVYGKMTDCDLSYLYLYLRAIPSLPGNRD
jgi:hypothetical protein